MATTPTYPAASGCIGIHKAIVAGDSTNIVDILDNSAGTCSARVEALNICSSDGAANTVQLHRNASSTDFLMGTVSVATLAGTNGTTARVNALATFGVVSPDGIPVIEVPAGEKLRANVGTALTSSETVTITGWAREYD